MNVDPWNYAQVVDASRLRMAALSVELAAGGGAQVTMDARGGMSVAMPGPWWAAATLGLWTAYTRRKVVARCRDQVPQLCGFCPQIEVSRCRR